MATRHQGLKKVGRFWHYSLKVNGQRVHGSTRATDLPTARAVMEEKRKELLNGQINRSTRIVTVKELVQEWLTVNKAIFSKGHLASTECSMRHWVFPMAGSLPVKGFTTREAMAIRAFMLEKGCSPTYVNNVFKNLNAICRYGIRAHYLQALPYQMPKLKVQKKPRPVLPAVRMKDFFAAVDSEARNPQIPVLIRVMVGLGLREAEALGMRYEWFNPEMQTYTVGKAKGKEARVLPVPDWLWLTIFQTMPKTISEWVFPSEDGLPRRPQFTKKVLQRVCRKLELGNLTQHRLRATYASMHAEAGTPITEIQKMLGHKSVETTMVYVETSLEALRRAQDALSQKLGLFRQDGIRIVEKSAQKLSWDQIAWADQELSRGRTQRSVAQELGVSDTAIRVRRAQLLKSRAVAGADLSSDHQSEGSTSQMSECG